MSAALAAPTLSARFASAIGLLCRGLTVSLPGHLENAALTLLAWTRLRRLLARFDSLVAAVDAGRVPVLRARAETASRPLPAKTALRPPGGSGWLLRLAPALETRLGRAEVETLLADPGLPALLAQAPRAGRILRPLCHMLAIETPAALRLPRRPRARPRAVHSGDTGAGAAACDAPAARPPLPWWLIRPASPPLPVAEEDAAEVAPPHPARTGPPGS